MILVRISLILLLCSCALATVSVPNAVIVGGILKAAALKSAAIKVAALKAAALKGLALKHIVIPAVKEHVAKNKGKYEELGQKLLGGLGLGHLRHLGGHHDEYDDHDHDDKHEVHYYHDIPKHHYQEHKTEHHSYHDHHDHDHKQEVRYYHDLPKKYTHGGGYQEEHSYGGHLPHYSYKYGVSDHHSGDQKSAWESRLGDYVKGEYTVKEPDGTKRIVSYHSDPKGGFVAHVKKVGTAHYGAHSHYVNHRADTGSQVYE